MIRVADYIAELVVQAGIKDVFMITGGGAMHLNDAFGRNKKLSYVCCHHEQACAIAAESYYRYKNELALVNVTTGPGGTNAITGVFGAWTDSLGMLVVSGQVKWETLVRSTDLPLRQLGDQEVDIVKLVTPITKYAVMITDPQTVRYHVEKAIYLARSGRPGPCWLDVPMNIQGGLLDPTTQVGFDPLSEGFEASNSKSAAACQEIVARLAKAERPVILAGSGVRLARAEQAFMQLVEKWQIPVVTAFNAHDLMWEDNPYYAGRPGTIGDRGGNFVTQNADFVLVLGCRLNIRQVSYGWESFARAAYKVMVDIDEAELKKPTLSPDMPIVADLADFLPALVAEPYTAANRHNEWLKWSLERHKRYPVVLPEYWHNETSVNPYCFAHTLFQELPENEVVVTGDGTACVVTFQAGQLKPGQRLYSNSGCASMGYDLPAAIGACIAHNRQRVICLAGDGSIQMNIQELQTLVGYNLPVKIFVLNNNGYLSIRQTQNNYFADNIVGCGPESGVTFPDMSRLATAYGIPFRRCHNHAELSEAIRQTIFSDGPQICEVMLDMNQSFAPKTSSKRLPDGRMFSAPLEDMAPFLEREEFLSNMLIPPMREQ